MLERAVASADQRLVLLAPPGVRIPRLFRNVPADPATHSELLAAVQLLRGRVYLEDGAIGPADLTRGGRYETPEDLRAWHLLIQGRHGVDACMWYLEHDLPSLDDLRVKNCPLNGADDGGRLFKIAVESELKRAEREHLHYVELGGWAVAPAHRHTGEGLLLALAAFSLGRAFGGALGLTTATVRHASSLILRRLGGTALGTNGSCLPPYYDPRYGCHMELLRFDSRSPNPKYLSLIETLSECLATVPVVACTEDTATEAPVPLTVPMLNRLAIVGGTAA